jgi:hypothetical protein
MQIKRIFDFFASFFWPVVFLSCFIGNYHSHKDKNAQIGILQSKRVGQHGKLFTMV